MPWLNYSVQVTKDESDRAEDALLDAGAQSVTVTNAGDSPVLEPGPGETRLWPRVKVTGLFEADADPDVVRLQLAARLGDAGLDVERVALEDRDWHRAWLDRLRPMRFGKHLWIVPGDREPPGQEDEVTIRLDPGLAFGSGTHATTALCLDWLDANPPGDADVIDYGCGSGILALAAARLGAKRVRATDHDPQALRATADNARRNDLSGRIEIVEPESLSGEPADILLANILMQPLIDLARDFAARLRPGGRVVLSGMLAEQAEPVERAYGRRFGEFEREIRDGWARVVAKRLN